MKVIIIGGGIGGLMAAILLKREGHEVIIYERDNAPRTMGAGLVLWPNATKLFLSDTLFNKVFDRNANILKCMNTYDNQGETLSELDIVKLEQAMGDYPAIPISRKELHQRLMQLIKEFNIEVEFGHKAINIDSVREHSSVTFDNGHIDSSELIIGADGRMCSVARKFVVGENNPSYMGYVNWVGIIENDSSLNLQGEIKDYWGAGERFGIVPLAPDSLYWAGCKVMSPESGRNKYNIKEYLVNVFKEWPEPIIDIINRTNNDEINCIPVYDLNPCQNLYKENVVLLGDCAHAAGPTSSQGACLAIEDAFCLSASLTNMPLDAALNNYQQLRLPKTTKITEYTRVLTKEIFETDLIKCNIRNEKRKNQFNSTQACSGLAALWNE